VVENVDRMNGSLTQPALIELNSHITMLFFITRPSDDLDAPGTCR